ncbi:MAG: DNA-binding Lrp family transcriptional regulator [Paracoccaceae bacterium]|jgi:DNA-binding Lrp family transcriptional regulator
MRNFGDPMLDHGDSQLLKALQKDAHLTAQELGDLLNMSPSQAGRRRQRLEQDGYILGFQARLDATRLGLNVQAFIQVSMVTHTPEAARSFQTLIRTRPEVVSAWTLTGEADYLLRVYCTDLGELNHLVHAIFLPHSAVARVQSQIVMDQTKPDAPLPI